MVVPLAPALSVRPPLNRLTPVVQVDGRKLVALTQLAGAVRVSKLGPVVASLEGASGQSARGGGRVADRRLSGPFQEVPMPAGPESALRAAEAKHAL